MNLQQALETIPGLEVFDRSPEGPPAGAYAVVSELTDGVVIPLHDSQDGRPQAIKELSVLVTLYGPEDSEKADLRPFWLSAKAVERHITAHPGIPRLNGVRLGAAMPPTYDRSERRPLAGVRFILNYSEQGAP